ncbi:hypothetical protein GX50_00550 [[Emmonsia] crescens]|uniref:Uncharacterized protein n=1 Tax=[Emmonsia] crescens TaxID=73230 RepID=A0A2B7ZU03_9EURO|nr:hypothetical protein GX50_00550 [Emmonsia crescens]
MVQERRLFISSKVDRKCFAGGDLSASVVVDSRPLPGMSSADFHNSRGLGPNLHHPTPRSQVQGQQHHTPCPFALCWRPAPDKFNTKFDSGASLSQYEIIEINSALDKGQFRDHARIPRWSMACAEIADSTKKW